MSDILEILVFGFLVFLFVILLRFSLIHSHIIMIIISGLAFLLSLIALFDSVNLVMIDSITLLQVDATIIAGAIILLTITSFIANKPHFAIATKFLFGKYIPWTPQQVASTTIAIFGISGFFILLENVFSIAFNFALIATLFGFGYLIIAGSVLAVKEKFVNAPDEAPTFDSKNNFGEDP